jgi:phage tail sheath protein FI
MENMKTPGVYIQEKNAFPNSVVQVPTAVPAFVGYTEKAENGAKSLLNKPWRITSLAEFHTYFGGAPIPVFELKEQTLNTDNKAKSVDKDDTSKLTVKNAEASQEASITVNNKKIDLSITEGNYQLYYNMVMFFQNGGGPCYIVSVGNYTNAIESEKLISGFSILVKEQEPTMLVIPDAVLLESISEFTKVQQQMLLHCGSKMKNRIALLDIYEGYKDRQDESGDVIENFRENIGVNFLDYGAAYYPWVNTSVVQANDLSFLNIKNRDKLQTIIRSEFPSSSKQLKVIIDNITGKSISKDEEVLINKTLMQASKVYKTIINEIKDKLNLLPLSAAIAGIYTMTDNSRGVWKTPANVSLNSVVSPSVNISLDEQEDLNVPLDGKAINAIRTFIGEGTLVWGARTLDGNSQDWRYINVRRTLIMLEESIRIASKAYVFEANTANTWVTVKAMIRNYLTNIWKQGGLAGASPDEAFSVHVGLGETMTANDILDGIMRISVMVAVSRPAEFIEITFQQQMQKS